MNRSTRNRKFAAICKAEENDLVSDSMEVRLDLIRQMQAGELTLEEIQSTLKTIKRNSKKAGKKIRNQIFIES